MKTYRLIILILSLISFSLSVYGHGEIKTIFSPDINSRVLPDKFKNGMHVIITGSGTGLSVHGEGGSSVAVICDGEILQFDMGMGVIGRYKELFIDPANIRYLFFTHLHVDHISDFPIYLFRYSKNRQFSIFGPVGTKEMIEGSKSFMATHLGQQGRTNRSANGDAYKKIYGKEYKRRKEVAVEEISSSGVLVQNRSFEVIAVPTPHLLGDGINSFAYRVNTKHGSVVISGDTAPSVNVVELAKGADLLIHEAMLYEPYMLTEPYYSESSIPRLEDGLKYHRPAKKVGHTTPLELGKIAREAGVGKLVVYHAPPFSVVPESRRLAAKLMYDSPEEDLNENTQREFVGAIKKSYSGPVVMAKPLMVFELSKNRSGVDGED